MTGPEDSPSRGTDAGEGDDAIPAPAVPTDRLDGWTRVEASVERLHGVEGADVRGYTLVYEDDRLRAAVRDATDGALDRAWRFFFATRLRFRPPLAPGVRSLVLPTVRAAATRSFCDDLRDRGVDDVERGRRERVRTDDGERVRIRQVTGTVPLPEAGVEVEAGAEIPVEGWVCVRAVDDIHVAGGAYPRTRLARALGLDGSSPEETGGSDDPLARDPGDDREELLALVTAVG